MTADDTETDNTETDDTDDSTDDSIERPGVLTRTVPAGALVIAIMVAAALGILAVVALTVGGDGDGDSDIEAARLAAGRFGERLLTVEEGRIDDWKAGVLSLSTGGFAEEVDEVEESFRRLIAEAELDVRARVTEIFLGPIDEGQVSAVLQYDREIQDAGGTRTETDRYLQMRLLHVDGEWLVDNVVDLSFSGGSAGATPTEPAPETTQTTPTTEAPPGG